MLQLHNLRSAELVGREAERAWLEAQIPSPSRPRARAVAIVGDAGIGKTRLADSVEAAAKRCGVRAIRAGAYEVDEPLPYSLLSDLFARWMREDPAVADLARDPRLLGTLGRFLPQLVPGPAPLERLSVQDEHFRLLEAATQLFRSAARDEPLLVIVEDAHWADRDSWSMLRYIARAMSERAVLFLLTVRPDDRGRDPDGLSNLARETDLQRVALHPLDLDSTGRLLDSLAGQQLPLAVVQTIHRESGGNPFYLRHVFEHLVEEGKLHRHEGRWSTNLGIDELAIPPGVRSLLMRRVGRLSEGALRMLRLASIFPDRFDTRRLLLLLGGPDDPLLDHLDESLELGLIVSSEGGYVFAHALVRRALYEAMNPDRRARLHRRAAEQLASSGDDAGEIARHYHSSRSIPGADVGVAFALRAAERAANANRYEHQAMFLRVALELKGDETDIELQRSLAIAYAMALDIEGAERTANRLFEIVRGVAPEGRAAPEWLLEFLVSMARRLRDAGAAPALWLHFVDLGLAACADRRDLTWARLTVLRPRWRIRWVGSSCGTTPVPLDPAAVEILNRLGDEDDISEMLDPFELRTKEQTEQLRGLAGRWRSAAAIIHARAVVARDWMFWQGDIPTAAERLRELARDSQRFGSLLGRGEAYSNLVWVEAALGRLDASDEAHREARAVTARLGPSHGLHFTLNVAAATVVNYVFRGDWQPLREPTRLVLDAVTGQQFAIGVFVITCSLMAEAFSPDPGRYEERVEALLCSLEQTDLGAHLASIALNFGVIAAHQREDVKRALRFEKLVREARARGISGGPFGTAHDAALGLLATLQGNNAGARKHFADARTALDDEGLLCFRAIVDFEDARVAGAVGDTEGWRAALEECSRRFDALGMTFWSECAAKLEACGPPTAVRNPHAAGPDGLTPREMEILGHLAAGGSAKSIASQLSLSVATVKRHVVNIYEKIG